jgi:hypothetical protein
VELEPAIELEAVALREGEGIGRGRDAVPDLLDQAETRRHGEVEDLAQPVALHETGVGRGATWANRWTPGAAP